MADHDEPGCVGCGVDFASHTGLVGTCIMLQHAKRERDTARAEVARLRSLLAEALDRMEPHDSAWLQGRVHRPGPVEP